MKIRIKAIWCCLFYGLMPWWVYEQECHYKGDSYWQHLVMNVKYAGVWIANYPVKPTPEHLAFEKQFNNNQ
mgnify:CR=1 FL=1